jgi:hypothetical protein
VFFKKIIGGGLWCFFRGILEKRVFRDGFLMVRTWWNVWLLWCFDGHFSVSKNMSLFENIFSVFPEMGIR